MSKPILYSYFRSSCSYRVRLALEIKNIEYEYVPVNIIKNGGEQWSPKYMELNPEALVPYLIDGNLGIAQSLSIIEYLDEKFPNLPKLIPTDLNEKAKVRMLSQIIACDIQPIQNLRVMKYMGDKSLEWAQHWINLGFKAFEKYMQKYSGKYCIGDQLTMVDVVLVPQIYNALRFQVDMSKYPIMSAINEKLIVLEPFKKAHPSSQLDCPPELKNV